VDPRLLTPILFAALIAWGIFRRLRRSFGRQRVDAARMWFRMGVLTLVSAFLLIAIGAGHDARMLEAFVAGVACGTALGVVGLRHTQFEVTAEGRFYTPHTYIGLVVTALFLGRLLYRYFYMYYELHGTAVATQNLALEYQRNPLTLAVFGAVVSYYVSFYLGILAKTRTSSPLVQPKPTE
jgi:hypothetical protein